jgi:tetratricopeptide (TPR) repeat protein
MALLASGRFPGAEGEHTVLAGLARRLGRDRTTEEKTERSLLKIAERMLAAELAMYRHQYDEALKSFAEAVQLEEELRYTEPPFWPIPIRHYLGAALLKAGRPGKAEAVYRADLAKNPRNGWAQFGLMQSLRAQRKDREAEAVEEQWKQAWKHADVTLTASRF